MRNPTLEERVAALEKQVAAIQEAGFNGQRPTGWQSTLGVFSGDEVMKRIDAAALKYRERNRETARKRVRPRQPKK